LVKAFPDPIRDEARAPVEVLLQKMEPPRHTPEVQRGFFTDLVVEGYSVSIPARLYDGRHNVVIYDSSPFDEMAGLLAGRGLVPRQETMFFCLLTRHHNGFVREAALCRIAAVNEAFVVPFIAMLASEYVYEILLQIKLRMGEFDPVSFGTFFRANPVAFARMRQRMVSYWDCYYRRQDYTSPDGELYHRWQDRYVGFDIFEAFERMAVTTA
jgi:hypothetical protein